MQVSVSFRSWSNITSAFVLHVAWLMIVIVELLVTCFCVDSAVHVI